MYRTEDNEDLRGEIFHLKKHLSKVIAENHLLKVKVRKLQNEVTKRDKQMDTVLDPRKSPTAARKILYEKSASFILNLRERNEELEESLQEKEMIIKRLQNQLEIMKLYSAPKKHYTSESRLEMENKFRSQLKMPSFKENFSSSSSFGDNGEKNKSKSRKNRSLSWTPGLKEAESTLVENIKFEMQEEEENRQADIRKCEQIDFKDQYKSLSKEHLLSIIENLKNNQRFSPRSRQASSRKSSPESDLERIELLCESPHEEIQQLHLHFIDMISEVDYLKNTILQLQNSQEKTENVLKKKDTNISKLAKEIKNLKRPKSKNNCKNRNNNEILTRIYSSARSTTLSAKTCPKFDKIMMNSDGSSDKLISRKKDFRSKKENNLKTKINKLKTKDVMTQVNDFAESSEDNPSTICVYIENPTENKAEPSETETTEKEEEDYGEEEFDECETTENDEKA